MALLLWSLLVGSTSLLQMLFVLQEPSPFFSIHFLIPLQDNLDKRRLLYILWPAMKAMCRPQALPLRPGHQALLLAMASNGVAGHFDLHIDTVPKMTYHV